MAPVVPVPRSYRWVVCDNNTHWAYWCIGDTDPPLLDSRVRVVVVDREYYYYYNQYYYPHRRRSPTSPERNSPRLGSPSHLPLSSISPSRCFSPILPTSPLVLLFIVVVGIKSHYCFGPDLWRRPKSRSPIFPRLPQRKTPFSALVDLLLGFEPEIGSFGTQSPSRRHGSIVVIDPTACPIILDLCLLVHQTFRPRRCAKQIKTFWNFMGTDRRVLF